MPNKSQQISQLPKVTKTQKEKKSISTTKSNATVKSWSMYPDLHGEVSHYLTENGLHFSFFHQDTDGGCSEQYDTNIMGRFKCTNMACHQKGWSSKLVAITIRMYSGKRYNARVYHQRCKRCESLSTPILDESYAQRIAYRLKIWNGVKMDRPPYTRGESEKSHASHLCEGCNHGHCSLGFS